MMKSALILVLLGLSLAVATPSRAQVEGSFCGDVEAIADGWRSVFPVGDPAVCPDLCRAWVQSCIGVVRQSKQCGLAVFEQLAVVSTAQCASEETAAKRAQCHRAARTQVDALKAYVNVQAETALAFCSDPQQTDDCVATCGTPVE
ncbi:MAG TPA: hypothetical protein VFD92_00550 [Candidatus Binatia bacterium]|nr:hypothetical protein [Candidatus Binatia bacterium]